MCSLELLIVTVPHARSRSHGPTAQLQMTLTHIHAKLQMTLTYIYAKLQRDALMAPEPIGKAQGTCLGSPPLSLIRLVEKGTCTTRSLVAAPR